MQNRRTNISVQGERRGIDDDALAPTVELRDGHVIAGAEPRVRDKSGRRHADGKVGDSQRFSTFVSQMRAATRDPTSFTRSAFLP
jgi:hypothetical protein